MIEKILRAYLPAYANRTLPVFLRWLVTLWVNRNADARAEVEALQQLRVAMQALPLTTPSPEIWKRIQTGVRVSKALPVPTLGRWAFWGTWATGMSLIILSLVLLWYVLPPGVVLQWTATGGEPTVFRIYRAAGVTEPFELLEEIAAGTQVTSLDARVYSYRDIILLPGQEYVYRVEMVDQNGGTFSQMIVSSALEMLPGQLTVLISLLVVLYGASLVLPKRGYLLARVIG
jgi:hypothetical protein